MVINENNVQDLDYETLKEVLVRRENQHAEKLNIRTQAKGGEINQGQHTDQDQQ